MPSLAQHLGEALVERGYTRPGVDHEQDHIGIADGDLGLLAHPVFERAVGAVLVTGRVEHLEVQVGNVPVRLAAVACYAGRVIDQRDLAAHQPIEQRGLSDIGAADNGNGYGHRRPQWVRRLRLS